MEPKPGHLSSGLAVRMLFTFLVTHALLTPRCRASAALVANAPLDSSREYSVANFW